MELPIKDEFFVPTNADVGGAAFLDDHAKPSAYLCGNSLGLLSKRSKALILEELDVWAQRGVEGHFLHPHGRNWKDIADHAHAGLAPLVGALTNEIACMGTLTANLHLLMSSFYRPTKDRFKILCEARAFPSDQYAFASQALSHGLDPKEAIIEVSPRPGEFVIRKEDILDVIEKEGDTIAVVLFSGVQYYTGQLFPIKSITEHALAKGAKVGWDLAHAIGNVPLQLHDWNVDFAVWCSYKYLNSGPGGIGGIFVHDKWTSSEKPRHAGWWGHDPETRFQMPSEFVPIPGAQGFQQSNPSVLSTASLVGSLQLFSEAGGIEVLRKRSLELTCFLEDGLRALPFFISPDKADVAEHTTVPSFTIITPQDPEERGAQLSLLFLPPGQGVMQAVLGTLQNHGVVGDARKPDVIRLAPVPLYNITDDCARAVTAIDKAFHTLTISQKAE